MQTVRTTLEGRLREIVDRRARIAPHLRTPGGSDQVVEGLEEEGHDEEEQIRAALGRLDAGTYGTCQICGGRIEAARLDALPWTATCRRCAELTS